MLGYRVNTAEGKSKETVTRALRELRRKLGGKLDCLARDTEAANVQHVAAAAARGGRAIAVRDVPVLAG